VTWTKGAAMCAGIVETLFRPFGVGGRRTMAGREV
jgi:hypothetical protein